MKVLIADSQSRVRNALRVLLRQSRGLEIVGEATSASELLSRVAAIQPDLVLLHWRLSGATGEELLTGLRATCPDLRILVLSVRPESRQEALTAGADAFVSKMDQPERLLAAIQCIRQAEEVESASQEEHTSAADAAAAATARGCRAEPLSGEGIRGTSHPPLAASMRAAS